MISSGVSPRSKVFLKSHAMSKATMIPSKYIASMVRPDSFRKPRTVIFGIQAPISSV